MLSRRPGLLFPWGSFAGANDQDACETQERQWGPGAHISPHRGAILSPADASQPEAPPLRGYESPFSFSLWNNRVLLLTQKQLCR